MISVTGLDGIAKAVANLARAQREIPRETRRALREVAPRLVRDARDRAEDVLPRRGGYAHQVATTTRFTIEVNHAATGTTLRITATGPDKRLDTRGRLRHPVYADGPRSEWNWAKEAQRVTPGWFTEPMRLGSREVRIRLVTAGSRAIRGR